MEGKIKAFKELTEKLNKIRLLMGQQAITCEFSGERILIIDEENAPEYLGPEFEIGSVDILSESHKVPEMKNIMDALVSSELLGVYKSYS
ncbi:MAG: hypothetical protein WA063_03670 [Minisyncoccia bacterium]